MGFWEKVCLGQMCHLGWKTVHRFTSVSFWMVFQEKLFFEMAILDIS